MNEKSQAKKLVEDTAHDLAEEYRLMMDEVAKLGFSREAGHMGWLLKMFAAQQVALDLILDRLTEHASAIRKLAPTKISPTSPKPTGVN